MVSRGLRKRFADDHGATILMALLALLVVSMVAATILAAANSTVRQAKADQEFEQNSLSLQSAANFIAEDLRSDKGFKVVASRTVTDRLNSAGSYDDPVYGDWKIEAEGDSYFAKQLTEAVNQVYYAGGEGLGYFRGADSTISATFKDSASGLDKTVSVRAVFEMEHVDAVGDETQAQDTLVFELSPAEYDDNGIRFRTAAEDAQTLYVRLETKFDSQKATMLPEDGEERSGIEKRVYTWNVDKFSASSNKI